MYVTRVVPDEIPVMVPLLVPIVPMAVLLLLQVPGLGLLDSVAEEPTQTEEAPEILSGKGLTMISSALLNMLPLVATGQPEGAEPGGFQSRTQ